MDKDKFDAEVLKVISFIRSDNFTIENVLSFHTRFKNFTNLDDFKEKVVVAINDLINSGEIVLLKEGVYKKTFEEKYYASSREYKGSDSEMVKDLTSDLTICDLHEDGA